MVSVRAPAPHVAVATAAPLLDDALRVVLDEVAVVTVVDARTPGVAAADGGVGFDAAVTTSPVDAPPAEVTIVLDDGPDARGGGAVVVDGAEVGRLADLPAVVAYLGSILHGDR